MRVKRIFTKKWSSLSFWLWITTSQKEVTKIIMQLVHWNKKGNIIHVGYFSPSKYCCCCLVTKSCATLLCDPMDLMDSPWGSSVHGISQARLLEWVAISSSRGSSPSRDWTQIYCISCIGRWILYHWVTRLYIFLPFIQTNMHRAILI